LTKPSLKEKPATPPPYSHRSGLRTMAGVAHVSIESLDVVSVGVE
jgi:hypothetical protein